MAARGVRGKQAQCGASGSAEAGVDLRGVRSRCGGWRRVAPAGVCQLQADEDAPARGTAPEPGRPPPKRARSVGTGENVLVSWLICGEASGQPELVDSQQLPGGQGEAAAASHPYLRDEEQGAPPAGRGGHGGRGGAIRTQGRGHGGEPPVVAGDGWHGVES